jgi:GTP-binding protein
VDKPEGRPFEVQDEVFELFDALGATDEQLDFQTIFASAKNGWAGLAPDDTDNGMAAIFDMIIEHVPAPVADREAPFSMLATTLEVDPFLGRILTGRIFSGSASAKDTVHALDRNNNIVETGRISKLLSYRGLKRTPIDGASAGDIVAIAGLSKATVADTICSVDVAEALEAQPVDPPTLAMTFGINNSPLAGKEGSKVTSSMIRTRLLREAEGNVAIRVTESDEKDAFEVAGRGELQLGVLIEQMRREGFELSISRPRVLFRDNPETGQREEPMEEVQIDVDEEFSGIVVEAMNLRKGRMVEMKPSGGGKVRLTFIGPARGLIGYHGEFLTETRGTGIMSRSFHSYAEHQGKLPGRRNGVLISNSPGKSNAYGLFGLEGRGQLFIGAGVQVYDGMIIGEHSRGNDLEVNPMKAKQLTNVRASGTDDAIRLTPPKRMTLEQAIAYIEDDELVEVTPENLRLRKRHLDTHARKKALRASSKES